jgi:proteasome lid subunit RPN8/RPN11
MKIQLENGVLQQVQAHAESGYPAEVCGFLLGSLDLEKREIRVEGGRPATNERVDAAHRRYLIEPAEYRTAEREATDAGTQIVGIYHSHPDAPAEPSTFDLTHAWPNQVYIIVSVNHGAAGDLKGWVLTHDRQSFNQVKISDYDARRSPARVEGATCLRF